MTRAPAARHDSVLRRLAVAILLAVAAVAAPTSELSVGGRGRGPGAGAMDLRVAVLQAVSNCPSHGHIPGLNFTFCARVGLLVIAAARTSLHVHVAYTSLHVACT